MSFPLPSDGDDTPLADAERELITSPYGLLPWFEAFGRILDKDRNLVAPVANPLQIRVADAISYCLVHDIPIRLLLLKPRQRGCSTISIAAQYWLLRRSSKKSVIMGGKLKQVRNLWDMLETYHANDTFPWPGGSGTVQSLTARWDNGSQVAQETARDAEAGRSATYQSGIFTEAARWREQGNANATAVMAGILNTMPDNPGTMAILESTAAGDSGMFYDNWQGAAELEDPIAGHRPEEWNGFIRVFSPWYEHADSCHRLDRAEAAKVASSYTDEEREMVAKWSLTPGHISWYRKTLRSECKRDPSIMKREYPGTPEEAFHSASRRRFNGAGLAILDAEARQAHRTSGLFTQTRPGQPDTEHVFTPCEESQATMWEWEPPTVGHSYIIAVDIATGASQTDADDPDHHCAQVIRTGYLDPDRGWQRPAIVAATPKPCRWDIDIFAEVVRGMASYYGGAMIVPEANNDRGLILMLRNFGCTIYQRSTDDQQPAGAKSSKLSGKYGFMTTGGAGENTRNWIIENLARQIREWDYEGSGIYVPDLETIAELKKFIVLSSGRAEAGEGEHDDRVITLAIGLACARMATTYRPQIGAPSVPRDIAIAEQQWRQRNGGRAQFS